MRQPERLGSGFAVRPMNTTKTKSNKCIVSLSAIRLSNIPNINTTKVKSLMVVQNFCALFIVTKDKRKHTLTKHADIDLGFGSSLYLRPGLSYGADG